MHGSFRRLQCHRHRPGSQFSLDQRPESAEGDDEKGLSLCIQGGRSGEALSGQLRTLQRRIFHRGTPEGGFSSRQPPETIGRAATATAATAATADRRHRRRHRHPRHGADAVARRLRHHRAARRPVGSRRSFEAVPPARLLGGASAVLDVEPRRVAGCLRRIREGPTALSCPAPVAIYCAMKPSVSAFSGRLQLIVLDDRARLPWRFLARHMTIDAL